MKISKSKKGKPNIAMLGKKWSDESRKKLSISTKKRLSDKTKHPMYGKHTTPWNKGKKGLQVGWNKGKKNV